MSIQWNFLTDKFLLNPSLTPEQNMMELEARVAETQIKPTFSVSSAHIAGTRTSAVIFTPTVDPEWTEDELVGQRLVAFVSSDPSTFSVHKVEENATDSVTIVSDGSYGDSALLAACDRIVLATDWETMQDYITYTIIDNDIDVTGDLDVSGALAVTGNATVGGTFGVTGNMTAGGTMGITGNTTVGGTLGVTGNTTLSGTASIGGDITLENGEKIKNDTDGQLDFVGNIAFVGGTKGGLIVKTSEATATLSGASTDIDVDVPAGKILLGTQFQVETAVTSGDGGVSWDAAYKTGATATIASGQAFAQNTKGGAFFDANGATAITSDVTKIAITPDSGTFSGGVIRAITYYLDFITMADV